MNDCYEKRPPNPATMSAQNTICDDTQQFNQTQFLKSTSLIVFSQNTSRSRIEEILQLAEKKSLYTLNQGYRTCLSFGNNNGYSCGKVGSIKFCSWDRFAKDYKTTNA